MRFELYVAARYLKAKRRQAVVGVVTAISIAGVAAGVAALIIALAITNGMRRDLQDRLVDSSAHVQLMRVKNDGIRDWQPLIARLSKLPHIVSAAPELDEQVVVTRGAREGYALVEGIVPAYEKNVSKVLTSTSAAAVNALEPPPAASSGLADRPLILGKDLADSIGATIGDSVTLISPQGDLTPLGVVPNVVHFRLAGTYHSGFYQYDQAWGFIRLNDAQRLYDEPDLVSVISFRVDNLDNAPAIAHEIEQAAGTSVNIAGLTVARVRLPPVTTFAPPATASSIHSSIRTASASSINEEMSVDCSYGWPILSASVAAFIRSTNSSAMVR